MSNPDTFDRQFRRTARGMRRRPAAQTWDRIEHRLDRRSRTPRFFGIRPWMIAAVVLLVAGFATLSGYANHRSYNPLAQRAETLEELGVESANFNRIPDYTPLSEGRTDGQLVSRAEPRSRLAPAPKYRF